MREDYPVRGLSRQAVHGMARPTVKSKRLGKSGEEIFSGPSGDSSASPPKRRGRRPSHTEHWTKVTVVLFDRQIVFLDRLSADIRSASGVAISRAILTARLGRYRV
jgi:hypothetical protein